jgi:hypothetical protein
MPLVLGICMICLEGTREIARADTVPAAFTAAVEALQDYEVTITAHETDGRRTQDRVVRYWYKKPTTAKIEVLGGMGRGSAAVWHGGGTVHGHQGGLLSMIKLTVGLHDARATSLRGDTIDSAYFGSELEHFRTTKGELTEISGVAIKGVPVDTLALKIADPATNGGVSKEVLFLSRVTHLPIERERFVGETSVKTEIFTDLSINPGLRDKDFML